MTIKEVSEKFNITQDTLRYYEREGLINAVPKEHGIRNYGPKEIDNVEFVVCMRGAGVSIETLKKYIKLISQGDETAEERRNLLIQERSKLKAKLEDMQNAFEKLNYKIDIYYSTVKPKEKEMINSNLKKTK